MNILWFAWKDMSHPAAGGAELVTDQILTRAVRDGHKVILLCGGFEGGAHKDQRHGYEIIRVGGRVTVYLAAWRYYREQLRTWADLIIEEVNTMPFMTQWYVDKKVKRFTFFHQLAREVWFYEFFQPLSSVGFWLAEPFFLWCLRKNRVITVSESTKKDLVRFGFMPEKIDIIPEGFLIKPVENLNAVKADKPTMLSLGSTRAMKRGLDHIRGFEYAKKGVPELQLWIAGGQGNPYWQEMKAAIDASEYKESIAVFGRVSDDEKLRLMREAHLVVMTSMKEGWGLVVTEANSQGTPAVVYDVDGLRDSTRNNETGYVVSPDPHSLGRGIVKLLEDPKRYAEMRKAGWEWAKTLSFDETYKAFCKITDI